MSLSPRSVPHVPRLQPQPKSWVTHTVTGFVAIAIGLLVLAFMHAADAQALTAQYMNGLIIGGFCVAAAGFLLLLYKYLTRRAAILLLRADAAWRGGVLQTAPFGMMVHHSGRPVFLNAAAQAWLGAATFGRIEDLASKVSEVDKLRLQECLIRLRDDRQIFTLDTKLRDGARPVRLIAGLLPDEGEVVWLVDRNEEKDRETAWLRERSVLEAELARFSVMVQGVPRPLWLRKLSGALVWCNDYYATAMDAPREKVVEEQIEFAPGSARKLAKELGQKAVETGTTQTEERHVVVEGTRRLYRVFETPAIVEGYVVGFAVDQTELEETRNELARHVSAFEETLEQLGAPIAIYDTEQRLRFYNHAYLRLWQLDEAFVRSAPSYSDVLEDLRQRRKIPEVVDFQNFRREQLARFTRQIETDEELTHLPDGTTIRVLYIPHPLGGLMLVTEDVTDKLALESSYNTLIAVQQETLDNLAEGILVVGSDGRMKLTNPAFARIWRMDADTLDVKPHIGDVLDQMKPLLEYEGEWNAYRQQLVADMLDRNTRQHRLIRGDKSIIDWASVPLPDGNVLHSYLDVTDTARVETALRTTNRALAAADKLKSEFVANVSYQLRTPLSTIIGFSEILTNQYFGKLNDRQMDYAKTILEASRKLLALINTVLDLATIEAGRMMLTRRPITVMQLFNDATAQVADWAARQQLKVVTDVPESLDAPEVDDRRMGQVLFNLLTNAVQYTQPGGTITLGANQKGDRTILTITDTGIGMNETEQGRVFNKFERANPQARQPGVGLGLSLVKSLVELHGGTVELHSEVGKGTRVICTLPTRAVAVAPQQATGS